MTIIRLKEEEGLEHLVEKLRALPEDKRKVIVLVGRHRNEGTHLIARRHHKEWEEHGAVVIQIPTKWTPHVFWNRVFQGKAGKLSEAYSKLSEISDYKHETERIANTALIETHLDNISDLAKRAAPSDFDIADQLAVFNVPIVNFHATPYIKRSELRFLHGRVSNIPFLPTHSIHTDYSITSPNMLAVEYDYYGALKKRKPHFPHSAQVNYEIIERALGGQLDQNYMRKPIITTKALEDFKKTHNTKFISLIQALAKEELRK